MSQIDAVTWRRPTEVDWADARPLIEAMFETRTLDEIRKACKFDASNKMFRTRFRRWHLRDKNNKETEVSALLKKFRTRDRIEKTSHGRIRGKTIDMQEITRYAARKHMSLDQLESMAPPSTPPGIECRTPSPVPIDPPAVFANAERMFGLIQNYTMTCFRNRERQATDARPFPESCREALVKEVYLLSHQVQKARKKRDTILTTKLQHQIFYNFPALLRAQYWQTPDCLLYTLFEEQKSQSRRFFELGNWAATFGLTYPSEDNSLCQFLALFCRYEHQHLEAVVVQSYRVYANCIEESLGRYDSRSLRARFRLNRDYGEEMSDVLLLEMKEKITTNQIKKKERDRLAYNLALYYYRRDADESFVRVVESCSLLGPDVSTGYRANVLVMMSEYYRTIGKLDEAVTFRLEAVKLLDDLGNRAISILSHLKALQKLLRAQGRREEAKAARAAYSSLRTVILEGPADKNTDLNLMEGEANRS